jgi:Tol biopolymer transport system component
MLAFVSDRDGNPEIYTSNADGTGLRRLTNNAVADLSPVWSPDGNKIAFTRDRGISTGYSDIYVMNADGSNVVQVTNGPSDVEPAWSPDGTRIAYAGFAGIYVQNIDQPFRTPEQLGYGLSWNNHPSWSPDGQYILFGSDYGTGDSWSRVWRVRTQDLHAPAGYLNLGDTRYTVYMLATWAPDASRFAFAACDWFYLCTGPGGLYTTNADGSSPQRITDINNIDGITWSPDGSIIAYSSRGCPECSVPSIYHITTDGRMRGLVISDAYMPAWRPVP